MPVRDGRYVSYERLALEEAAKQAAAPEVEVVADEEAPVKAKAKRRSRGAAQAAIKQATGVDIDLDEQTGKPVEDEEPSA